MWRRPSSLLRQLCHPAPSTCHRLLVEAALSPPIPSLSPSLRRGVAHTLLLARTFGLEGGEVVGKAVAELVLRGLPCEAGGLLGEVERMPLGGEQLLAIGGEAIREVMRKLREEGGGGDVTTSGSADPRLAFALCGCLLHCSLLNHSSDPPEQAAEGMEKGIAGGREEEGEPVWLQEAEGRLQQDAEEWGDGCLQRAIESRKRRERISQHAGRSVTAAEAERMLQRLLPLSLSLAPEETARLLATCGRWDQLLRHLSAPQLLRVVLAEVREISPSVERRLELVALRAQLAPPPLPPPSTWAKLLPSLEPDGGGPACEGGRLLLRLALTTFPSIGEREGIAAAAAQLQVHAALLIPPPLLTTAGIWGFVKILRRDAPEYSGVPEALNLLVSPRVVLGLLSTLARAGLADTCLNGGAAGKPRACSACALLDAGSSTCAAV
ncbi:MAG: hypothetical protein SGPRY_003815 [Prymnesium sp.]